MLKTVVIGKKIEGATQLTQQMVMSGDKIVLVDTAGHAPKHVTTKMVGRDLHIFADGASEPSAILNDYASFEHSVEIQGIGQSGAYYDYAPAASGGMEMASTPVVAPVAAAESGLSTNAMWGIGILAAAGGIAAAAGGGGGGGSTASTTTTDTTAPIAPVVTAVATDNIVNALENTNLVISGTGEVGATVTLAVAKQTAIVDGSGNWSITVVDAAATFGEGAEGLSVTQKDVAGNVSAAGTRGINIDTIAPVLTITDDETAITANIAGGDILYTFKFDEAVSGFDINDIVIDPAQGTAKTFTVISSTEYTLGVTPLAGYEGDMTISVDNASYTDIAGNMGSADVASTQVVDMSAPTYQANSMVADADHESIVLTYIEALESVNMSNPGSFVVMVDADGAGAGDAVASTVLSVGMVNDKVTLILADGFDAGAVVGVTYADVTGDATPAIQDLAGNDASSLDWQYATAAVI